MIIYLFDLKIVFLARGSLWGALLDLSELHFGSQEAPQELSGSSLGALSGSLGAHNLLTSSVDRHFGALWELLGALLTAYLRSGGLQSSQMWCSELSASHDAVIWGPQHMMLSFRSSILLAR